MWLCKYWKADICGLIILLMVGFFLWLGNKKMDDNYIEKINKCYVPSGQNHILTTMEESMKNMTRIICARSDYISLLTSDNNIINYRYEYEAIWYNDNPLMRGVKSFHFEFRDKYGILLTHFGPNYTSIATIGYYIRKCDDRQEIIFKNMIDVSDQMLCYVNY